MIICLDAPGRVLVDRQYCHPPGRAVYEFPGGAQIGESYAEAATRELMEEAGLRPGRLEEIGAFLVDNRRSAARMRVFLATECVPESSPQDDTEDIENFWFTPAAVDRMIEAGEIENATLLGGWAIFKSKFKPCT